MDSSSFKILLDKYITHSITTEERKQLAQLLQTTEYNTELETIIDQQLASNQFEIKEDDDLRQLIFDRIQAAKQSNTGPVRSMPWFGSSRTIKRIAIAASILLVISLGIVIAIRDDKSGKQSPAIVSQPSDVSAPTSNRAAITLADGRTIYLDSADNGQLATQQNVQLIKTADGKIVYTPSTVKTSTAVAFNTLSNPRGSKVIDMTLADGSHVWLNAGSSITYPVAFIGNERKVTITGEAYFEVAHLTPTLSTGGEGARRPFIVSKGNMQVQVLGTHFNVNAYDDESEIKVTLLEGSVRVAVSPFSTRGEGQGIRLTPGQQAVLTDDSRLTTHGFVDLEAVMAWKNGTFQLNAAGIETIMRQIARWYDVEIIYEGAPVTQVFYGTIPRTVSAANVFKVLEETGGVRFKIEGRKVTVMK